jgi:hypothetical protein
LYLNTTAFNDKVAHVNKQIVTGQKEKIGENEKAAGNAGGLLFKGE